MRRFVILLLASIFIFSGRAFALLSNSGTCGDITDATECNSAELSCPVGETGKITCVYVGGQCRVSTEDCTTKIKKAPPSHTDSTQNNNE